MSKNSVLLKGVTLAVVAVLTWISITSACYNCSSDDTYGNVCFTFNLGNCTLPSGTTFCMQNSTCGDLEGAPGPLWGKLNYGTPVCCTLGGGTSLSEVTGTVSYKGHIMGTPLYTWAEAGGATSCAQAEAWFEANFPSPPFTVTGVNCPLSSNTPCTVCVSKEPSFRCLETP